MRYILFGPMGWDHRPYWTYLSSVRAKMPPHLYSLAANPENHDLKSPNSLHDAWLERFELVELRRRNLQINLCLLGPQHDRHINLSYKGVMNYGIHNPDKFIAPHTLDKGHGDLLVHEVTIIDEGLFSHELLFSKGTDIYIEFTDMEHQIQMID